MEEEMELRPWKPVVSAVMLAAGLLLTHFEVVWFAAARVQALWYVAAFLPVGWGVMCEAWEGMSEHHEVFSEFTLMTLAAIGAFAIGEYPEAVAVMLLYCVGELFQDKAVDRARDHIKSIVAFRPDRAMVVENGQTVERNPDDVAVGSLIEVKPGERVPLDGVLVGAAAHFDTAALTGESLPRLIASEGEVAAGMIATDRPVQLRTTRVASQSAMARILDMVQQAKERKAPAELFIRRFARIYTPAVVSIAMLTVLVPWLYGMTTPAFDYHFGTWLHRALVFLVISCPCALVISVPLTYFGGIGAASRRGILIKGGNYLDALTHVDTVVFDKTGTLTTGRFAVSSTEGLSDEALDMISAMERSSNHPIAQAVCRHHPSDRVVKADDIAGFGLSAQIDGHTWLVGTLRLLQRGHIAYPEALDGVQETIVACAADGIYQGCLLLADTPKNDARQAISALRAQGVVHTEMLSGDKQAIVDKVAVHVGVDKGLGDLLPADKVARIETLKQQGRHVAFVGDGINDAPVLALSDVGVAMGALGTDMAVETADVIIQTDQPSKIAEAIALARRTRSIVRQNIVFAIGVKVLVMLLGLWGMANLWEAVFADSGVALLAVLNAMRVLRVKQSDEKNIF